MALVKCPECGRENVSDSAKACPDCGYGVKAHFDRIRQEEKRKLEEKRKQEDKKRIVLENKKEEELQRRKNMEQEETSITIKNLQSKMKVNTHFLRESCLR